MNKFQTFALTLLGLSAVLEIVNAQSKTPTFEIDVGRHKYLQDFGEKVRKACTDFYPKLAKFLSSPGYYDPDRILIRFDPEYDGVAYAEWDKSRITGSTKYYREHQDDVGSMIHETVHIVQKYHNGYGCPGWYTEGLADYVRYFQYEPAKKPGKPGRDSSYEDGYGTAAFFLNYVIEKVKGGKNAVLQAHQGCRDGKYRDTVWKELTNKDLTELWNEMQEKA